MSEYTTTTTANPSELSDTDEELGTDRTNGESEREESIKVRGVEPTDDEGSSDDDDGDDAAELAWRGLKVFSPDGSKVLLHDACGKVKGRLLAIMGPSGAGKTSMLNMMAHRLGEQKGTGDMTVEGRQYNSHDLKKVSGYVMQDDLLFPYLTVRETMLYSAFLRLPSSMKRKEKIKRAEAVMEKLGLAHTQHTQVGDSLNKGISGGERKRLCVGMELLTNPRVLFLDEPTSGLDSVTALTLVRILRDLAHNDKVTVVCTIHQPSTKIFNLFDDLMVLKHGKIVYHGPVDDVLDYYASAGFPCPRLSNPADHVLDVITPVAFTPEGIAEADANAAQISSRYKSPTIPPPQKGKLRKKMKFQRTAPWWLQFLYLFQRSFRNVLRARLELILQFICTVIIAILIGAVFLQIGDTQYSTTRRQPVLFFVAINQGIFAALILMNSFPAERAIVLRERAAGMYGVSSYYLAKSLAEMLIQLIFPLIFSIIVYWMVGLQATAGKFFLFVLFMELCALTAMSLALMIAALCRTITLSITVLPVLFEICRLLGGYYLSPADLPAYFSWLDALSFVKYTYVGISLNELHGLSIGCKSNELNNGTCPITSGQQTIDKLGLDYIPIWACVLVLLAMIIFFRLIAYFALRFEWLWGYMTWATLMRQYHWRIKPMFSKNGGVEELAGGGEELRGGQEEADKEAKIAAQDADLHNV